MPNSVSQMSIILIKGKARTLASTTAVETAVSVTVTVEPVAVDRKQLQTLLMQTSVEKQLEKMASAGSSEAVVSGTSIDVMVGARFKKMVETSLPVLLWR